MLEKLTHPRVFLYRKIKKSDTNNKVNWQFIKRFSKFPEDLETNSGFLRCMSPCFKYYIDINRALNVFVIRDTIVGNIVHSISRDLMNL